MVSFASDPILEASVSAEHTKLPVNQQQLKAAWDCSNVTTRGEWLEWIKRLGNDLMRESPCQAIRASRTLAEVHQPFSKELFNVAFVSCWTELYESYQVGLTPVLGLTLQEDLVHNLEQALQNPVVPPDVVNVILNLAEFMEHDDKALAIEARLLGDYVSNDPLLMLTSGDRVPCLCESSSLQGDGVLRRCISHRRRGLDQHQSETPAK